MKDNEMHVVIMSVLGLNTLLLAYILRLLEAPVPVVIFAVIAAVMVWGLNTAILFHYIRNKEG